MMASFWKPLGAIAPVDLGEVHREPHQLAQWLARIARAYLEPAEDDSHTSLQWRQDLRMMVTGIAGLDGAKISLGLDLSTLSLALLANGDIADQFEAHGHSDKDVGRWLKTNLDKLGFDSTALDALLPYDLPPSSLQQGAAYDQRSNSSALEEIARYYENANLLLQEVIDANSHIKPEPSPIRIWPHHFDMATLISLEEGDFETARAVGVGLAIPDESHNEFYFYNYPWPRDERENLPALGPDTPYLYDGKVGALQPLSKIIGAKNQEAAARRFMTETMELFVRLLQVDSPG